MKVWTHGKANQGHGNSGTHAQIANSNPRHKEIKQKEAKAGAIPSTTKERQKQIGHAFMQPHAVGTHPSLSFL